MAVWDDEDGESGERTQMREVKLKLKAEAPFGRKRADGIFDSADESLNGQLEFSSRTPLPTSSVSQTRSPLREQTRRNERQRETVSVVLFCVVRCAARVCV